MGSMNLTIAIHESSRSSSTVLRDIEAFIADVTAAYEPWAKGSRGGDAKTNAQWWRKVKREHPLAFAFLNWRLDGKATKTHPYDLVSMLSWTGFAEAQQLEYEPYQLFFSTNCHHWAETDFLKCYLKMHFGVYVTIYEEKTLAQCKAMWKRRAARRQKEDEKRKQAANA